MNYSDELDAVDASVFSGEMLYTNLDEFKSYGERWQRAIVEHEAAVACGEGPSDEDKLYMKKCKRKE